MLMGCGCSKALNGMRGVGAVDQSQIDSQYKILGSCDGGQLVQYPQGFQYCTPDSSMQALVGQKGYYNPANPFDPRSQTWVSTDPAPFIRPPMMAPDPVGSISPAQPANNPTPTPLNSPASAFDPMTFLQNNWMWVAGGIGAVVLFSTMK